MSELYLSEQAATPAPPAAGRVVMYPKTDGYMYVKNAAGLEIRLNTQVSNTAADWTSLNPILGVGIFGVETDTGRFKIGDGILTWTALAYWRYAAEHLTIPTTGGTTTLSIAQNRATSMEVTGVLTSNATIVVADTMAIFVAENKTTGAFTTTFKTAAGTGVAVPQGEHITLYADGVNVEIPISAGAATPHSALLNLDYASAGHTGFQPALGYTPANISGSASQDFNTAGLISDTTTLVVDDVNHRVGIGTATPATVLHVVEGTGSLQFSTGAYASLVLAGTNASMTLNAIGSTYPGFNVAKAGILHAQFGLDGDNPSYISAHTGTGMKIAYLTGEVYVTSGIISISPTDIIGYGAGAGGTVAQGSSSGKATGVTLAKVCGTITLDRASLAADTTVSFPVTLTGITVTNTSQMILSHTSVGTFGAYVLNARYTAGNQMTIDVHNCTPGALAEAIVIQYSLFRSVAA